ncbi:MAG: penicillin-binding protein 2 [Clostridia bacterium]|nr:penicillin-binding protein 2 [Clostridia bacterium]
MKEQRMNFKLLMVVLVGLFVLLAVYGGYSITTYGTRWFANSKNPRVRAEKQNAIMGDILDRNGVVLATTSDGERVYQADEASRRAMVHLLGDRLGNVSNGVETFQASYLLGFETSFAERLLQTLRGETRRGDNLTLTADSKLCTLAASAFDQNEKTAGKRGAAVVLNYKTGELLASVSLPNFDPNHITEETRNDLSRPFWNRATQSAYPPGSTFKIVTAQSALDNLTDAAAREFACTGALQVMDQVITDFGSAAHGSLSLEKAFVQSCNNVFASLALEIGDKKLRKTAEEFGFNDNFLFRDLVVENSVYPTENRNQVEIAWSGAGQSQVAATPLHMAMVAACIANNGVMMEPRLIYSAQSASGVQRQGYTSKVYKKVLTAQEAQVLTDYMAQVVASGTGSRAQVSGVRICGKTGSAESGLDGRDVTHGWFVGFMDDDRWPYAVAVLVEDIADGDGGGSTAAPIAQKIFSYLKNQ